jgi:23S rRNA (cytidine1920-2'-O)/16S rRNA (cytidine1409-2'-O)-methyltransferase
MKKSPRLRLDQALVARGLADSQKAAQALILAGQVRLDGAPAGKAGAAVPADARLELTTRQKFASRGGLKLEAALADFGLSPAHKICLDLGSSTGGFADCLLQHGAAKVFAVDVNTHQLSWKLQQDPRVIPVRRNARELTPAHIPEAAAFITADVSFISVCKILPAASSCAAPNADFLILIKPQFELRRADVPTGGVVSDSRFHKKAIAMVKSCAAAAGLQVLNVLPSRLLGAEGNQEFFLHAHVGSSCGV